MEQEFNAQIALSQTKQAVVTKQNKAFEEEYDAVIRQIKEAVRNGQFSVSLNISDRLLRQLILSNFVITRAPQDLAHKVTISWNEEDTPEQPEPQPAKQTKPSILKKKSAATTLPRVNKPKSEEEEEEMETVYEQPANLPSSPAGIINEEAEDMQDTSDENDDTDDNIDF